jgi:uncharacterized protein (DUF1684 family)
MKPLAFAVLTLALAGCSPKENAIDIEAYKLEIDTWHSGRVERLKAPTGWLSVAGLFWLNDGINTFGSDSTNDLIFPKDKVAGKAGSFLVKEGLVTLVPAKDAAITINGINAVTQVVFHPDTSANKTPQMASGSLTWFVIQRDDLLGIRLRDSQSEEVAKFTGIERYPVDPAWKVEATLEPSVPGATIDITNILGQTAAQPSPGALVFTINGNEHRLEAVLEGEELFMIYGDPTNGKETYGSGRYVYCKVPGPDGKTILDFNKSTNPPCAFTPYATCPLPPKQNILTVEVTAGEKNYGDQEKTRTL